MFEFHVLFFVVFLHLALVRADYTIDDSNYSILKFSENPSGPVWGPFGSDTGEVLDIRLPNGTMQTVDATQCYDGTYTYAACSASNNCAVQFSFTGSGITIYVLQAGPQGMSASLSIDSGTATTATLGAPPPPQYYIPHVTLFNKQNMPSGTHTAVMTVLDWNGSFSGMMLDYIDVNQAVVANPTTNSNPAAGPSPSPSPSPSPTPATQASSSPSTPSPTSVGLQTTAQQTGSTGAQTGSLGSTAAVTSIISVLSSQSSGATALPSSTSSSGNATGSPNSLPSTSKTTNVAAIVGGAVGGVLGLLALLCLAFCYFRRRRRQHLQALNERPSPLLLPQPEGRFTGTDPSIPDPFAALPASRLSGTARPLQMGSSSEAGPTPNFAAWDPRSSSPVADLSHSRIASSGNLNAIPSVPVSTGAGAVVATPPDQDAPTPTQLTSALAIPSVVPVSYPDEKLRRASGTPTRSLQQDTMTSVDAAGTRSNTVLTDEQADFVNSLFNNNVPAPVVARVLERMLANPQAMNNIGINDPELRPHVDSVGLDQSQRETPVGGVPWLPTMSDHGDGDTTVGTAPPSYDYVQAAR